MQERLCLFVLLLCLRMPSKLNCVIESFMDHRLNVGRVQRASAWEAPWDVKLRTLNCSEEPG